MSETGRNAPCPCGSGKKYKLCCLSKDDPSFQLDSVKRQLVASLSSSSRPSPPPRRRRRRTSSPSRDGALAGLRGTWEDDGLDDLSNGVVDDIHAGRFDEAEAGIARLREEFPEVIDWLDRSGMLAEARGDNKTAADFYRRCIAFTYANDGFDDESRSWMIDKIRTLDPDGPPPAGPPPGPTEPASPGS
jgi:hypothetical protein